MKSPAKKKMSVGGSTTDEVTTMGTTRGREGAMARKASRMEARKERMVARPARPVTPRTTPRAAPVAINGGAGVVSSADSGGESTAGMGGYAKGGAVKKKTIAKKGKK